VASALKYALRTSTKKSVFSWLPFFGPKAMPLNSILFASNGGVAEKNSSLLRFAISRATSLDRICMVSPSPLFISIHLTLIGCLPVTRMASVMSTNFQTFFSLKNSNSSCRASITSLVGRTSPELSSRRMSSSSSSSLFAKFQASLSSTRASFERSNFDVIFVLSRVGYSSESRQAQFYGVSCGRSCTSSQEMYTSMIVSCSLSTCAPLGQSGKHVFASAHPLRGFEHAALHPMSISSCHAILAHISLRDLHAFIKLRKGKYFRLPPAGRTGRMFAQEMFPTSDLITVLLAAECQMHWPFKDSALHLLLAASSENLILRSVCCMQRKGVARLSNQGCPDCIFALAWLYVQLS
jgi:hypothetical protein